MTRYQALDALRGLAIASMILVNFPGDWSAVYAPLLHAKWHGFTPTDQIFPLFLFIVGSAMYFAFSKSDFQFSLSAFIKITKRTLIIFAIGLALNAFPFNAPIEELRVFGVLQRIALCYFIAANLVLLLNRKYLILSSLAILVSYPSIFYFFAPENSYSLQHNAALMLDLAIVGPSHLYQGFGLPFDPEGLLSTLPAVVNVIVGFEVTRLMLQYKEKIHAVRELSMIGFLVIAIGIILAPLIPINKALWTSSYVFLTSGIAIVLLALFIYLFDIKQQEKMAEPLLAYGLNPLFIYVVSWLWIGSYSFIEITPDTNMHAFIYQTFSQITSAKFASLLFAILHVSLFWWFCKVLYQRRIVIKI
ncbi:DUF1624 domain-containing protein [Catenovulum sp. SM1970]|uniref:acyltransferase family protein n=1 Tax=Marinifaba aquimaris TaxID=2741323 RepID=UPI00157404FE|nr:heparan-alpha-glucosaminide N-acetyltransferase domain-containing protein [Marinifaba aquimaris]NTS78521.1 DUF1624 domain-containing protein [Marinifaba aquimaris]